MTTTRRRVLVFGADGLRPDLFDPEVMPNAARLAAEGVRFADHHAAWPSHTRVNASTFATGASPGRHGIVANTMLVPGATEDHIVETGQYQHLDALAAHDGGRAQLVTSLADVLAGHGERLAVAGTGSSGSNALWTFNHRGRLVNPGSAFGIADLYDLREKLGPVPERDAPTDAQSRYATSAVTDLYLHDPEIRVITLWLGEPDSSLHRHGVGSPESVAAMRSVDACLGVVLDEMERRAIRDQFDVFFVSDHGHSTIRTHKTLREFLLDARQDLDGRLPDLATASDFIYAKPGTSEPTASELAPLVEWLLAQPWVDIVAGGLAGTETLPGVIPLSALWNGQVNARRPLLAVSPAWSHDANAFGAPGTVAALTTQSAMQSTHGSLSPYEMHATLAGSGPSFRSEVVSATPSGATDLMPTILHILGYEIPATVDGRVLHEALAGGGGPPDSRDVALEPATPGPARRSVTLHEVGGTTYVHGSSQPGVTG